MVLRQISLTQSKTKCCLGTVCQNIWEWVVFCPYASDPCAKKPNRGHDNQVVKHDDNMPMNGMKKDSPVFTNGQISDGPGNKHKSLFERKYYTENSVTAHVWSISLCSCVLWKIKEKTVAHTAHSSRSIINKFAYAMRVLFETKKSPQFTHILTSIQYDIVACRRVYTVSV